MNDSDLCLKIDLYVFYQKKALLGKSDKIRVLTCRLKTHIIPCIPKGGGHGVKKAKLQIKS